MSTYLRFEGVLVGGEFTRLSGWETDHVADPPQEGDSRFAVVLRDGNGDVLESVVPQVAPLPGPIDMPTTARLVAYLTLTAEARELVLEAGGRRLHSEPVARRPPTVEILGVDPLDDGRFRVRWVADGSEARTLSYNVVYIASRDRAFGLARGLQVDTFVADLSSLPGSAEGRLAVLATDGTRSGFAVSDPFVVDERPPRVWILDPAQESVFPAYEPVGLRGHVTDVAGATLPAEDVTWLIDGEEVERGAILTTARSLGQGRHEITLRYAPPGSAPAEATVWIEVAAATAAQIAVIEAVRGSAPGGSRS